jgi:UDP-2-acetamido-3-amino-2,3-dideoxy-glucuronate N-acetyltransferase
LISFDELLFELPTFEDSRGALVELDFHKILPFVPKRAFSVYKIPIETLRGEHAHKSCEQFLIASSGSISVTLYISGHSVEYLLNSPSLGLYIPPKVWGVQHQASPDLVLSVFASESYNVEEYITDFQEFEFISSLSPKNHVAL